MKVFVHLRTQGKHDWSNTVHDFDRLPIVDEYVQIDDLTEWYIVQIVVHCPFNEEWGAEIYAVKVNHLDELKRLTS